MNSKAYDEKPVKNAIINLDNEGSGTHWTAIHDSGDHYAYYDSFGVEPPFTKLRKLIVYNPYKDQKDSEVNCGKRSFNWLRSTASSEL